MAADPFRLWFYLDEYCHQHPSGCDPCAFFRINPDHHGYCPVIAVKKQLVSGIDTETFHEQIARVRLLQTDAELKQSLIGELHAYCESANDCSSCPVGQYCASEELETCPVVCCEQILRGTWQNPAEGD